MARSKLKRAGFGANQDLGRERARGLSSHLANKTKETHELGRSQRPKDDTGEVG